MEPDTGTASVIVFTTLALFFLAGGSLAHVLTLGGIGAVTGLLLVLTEGYRSDRVFAFTSAEDDPSGVGFQTLQLLIALGSGGVEGLGLGVSRQKFFYIPGAHTDGIFAIIGEEAGLHRRDGRHRAVRLSRLPRLPRRDEGARRVRHLPRDGHRLLDRLPDPDQHRRHHAHDPADRHPTAPSSATAAHR